MNRITVSLPNGKTLETAPGSRAIDFIDALSNNPDEVYAVRVNNQICSLNKSIVTDCKVEPVLAKSKDGAEVYRRSLCFVMEAAMHEIDPNYHLLIGHSLGYGYYYTLADGNSIHPPLIEKLKVQMQGLINRNLPITTSSLSYEQAIDLFEEQGLTDTRNLLRYKCPPRVEINELGDFKDYYYAPLLVSTGYLKTWEIKKYGNGFLLRFPTSNEPDKLPEFIDIPQLFNTYERYKKWGKQIGITTAASLNQLVADRKINDFINVSESFQHKCIADIAQAIQDRGKVKLVLIAGPSSSGKTTSAKKLALELSAIGYNPKVISLDSYYVGRDKTPKDENGNYDYECLEALNVPLINQNLIDLFEGKTITLPEYDFATGTSRTGKQQLSLGENDILIMEGIHGLNDKLTPLVKPQLKFKIYLSALTQLNFNEHNRISTSDNRLIRRIVRDSQFRGKSASETIAMWESVQKGERLHIFPFQTNADAILNTALDYEMSVLKIFAEPLLKRITPLEVEYSEACRLLRFLDIFPTIDPTDVPDRSILREFIGHSAFKY
ncbi:MAG: nucleoside kinase [Treponema sp.]|nr:nucleoside kinase [Candidatus Treponema scatequi]